MFKILKILLTLLVVLVLALISLVAGVPAPVILVREDGEGESINEGKAANRKLLVGKSKCRGPPTAEEAITAAL